MRTIQELETVFGVSKRTIERRLKVFKDKHPDQFTLWVTHGDNNMKFYSPEIIDAIGLAIKVVPGEKLPPKKADATSTSVGTSKIIHIEAETADEQDRWLLFNQIVDEYANGQYILSDCCSRAGVTIDTFRRWCSFNAKMYKDYQAARDRFQNNAFDEIRDIAIHQVRKSMQGYDKHLESITYQQKVGPDGEVVSVPQHKKVTQKHILPNGALIMFSLLNRDKENWQKNLPTVLEGALGKNDDPLEQLSEEQMWEYLRIGKERGMMDDDIPEKII